MSASISQEFFVNAVAGIVFAADLIIFVFSASRAFRIRRALLVPLYRYQALWIGVAGLYWIIELALAETSVAAGLLNPALNTNRVGVGFSISLFAGLYVGLVLIFAWVDTMIRIGRNSDPRNRDTLRWSQLRLVLWAAIAIGEVWGAVSITPSILAHMSTAPIWNLLLFYSANAPLFFLTAGVGALALLVSSSRSGDIIFRRQLKWVGMVVLVLFIEIALVLELVASSAGGTAFPTGGAGLVSAVGGLTAINLILALLLYQSARSLAPVSRFPQP